MESHIDQKASEHSIPPPGLANSDDREALANVFRFQRQRLLHIALRLLGNAEDAEDAVQEGLLAALRKLDQFEGRARLSTWLTRIVVNAALMRLRDLRAHQSQPLDGLLLEHGSVRFSDMLVDKRPNPEELYARTEQRRLVDQELRGLSGPQRRAVSLLDFEGLTTKEAAQALGLSKGTVKSQVHRARRKLYQRIRKIQEASPLPNLAQAA